MSAIQEIRAVIEDQLVAIDREVLELRNALEALDANEEALGATRAAPAAAGGVAGRDRSARRRATARKKTAKVGDLRELTDVLGKSSTGLSAAAIAKQTNHSRDQIRDLLKDLEAAGKVRRTGRRRGTRWLVITDEDWIAQRAAELAARSTSAGSRRAA